MMPRGEPLKLDLTKIEVSRSLMPRLAPRRRSGGVFEPLRARMRLLKAEEWFLVPGSNLLSKEEKQAVRNAVSQCIKKENLKLNFGEDSSGTVIVYHQVVKK